MKKRKVRGTSVDNAVTVYAECNKSDPFAAARMRMYVRRGLDNIHEVAKESQRVLAMRKANTARTGNQFSVLHAA